MGGILLIDKPRDWTSFDVISRLRKLTGVQKIGHTGTLDPFADGLLPVCIGKATRLIQFMESHDKAYRVTVAFGRATDTQDRTGQVVFEHKLTDTERKELLKTDFAIVHQAVATLCSLTEQLPPLYSAVKVKGRPLYTYARKGQAVERKPRPIKVYQAAVDHIRLNEELEAEITLTCSKGTYIRSLCDTLGQITGWGAHAAALRRIESGPFSVNEAVTMDQLEKWLDGRDRSEALDILSEKKVLLPLSAALSDRPGIQIDRTSAVALMKGQIVFFEPACEPPAERVTVWCEDRLIAVAVLEKKEADAWRIRTERVLIDHADFLRS